jgi:DNA ligase-1
MLSAKAELDNLTYPLLASPKIDGIRCLVRDGVALSRTLKPIPNRHVQELLGNPAFNGNDGELVVGPDNAPDVYRRTNSGVMARDGRPEFTYLTFDRWDLLNDCFEDRLAGASDSDEAPFIRKVPHTWIESRDALLAYQEWALEAGYEGVMLRAPEGPYKFGRSTAREGWLMKLKTFDDAEAVVIGIEEEMFNGNEATIDALGHTKRSSHKENKVGKGSMGALIVRGLNGPYTGVVFNIGSGFTAADRTDAWEPGDVVTYKFFPHGAKDRPRHPVFMRRRSREEVAA